MEMRLFDWMILGILGFSLAGGYFTNKRITLLKQLIDLRTMTFAEYLEKYPEDDQKPAQRAYGATEGSDHAND